MGEGMGEGRWGGGGRGGVGGTGRGRVCVWGGMRYVYPVLVRAPNMGYGVWGGGGSTGQCMLVLVFLAKISCMAGLRRSVHAATKQAADQHPSTLAPPPRACGPPHLDTLNRILQLGL